MIGCSWRYSRSLPYARNHSVLHLIIQRLAIHHHLSHSPPWERTIYLQQQMAVTVGAQESLVDSEELTQRFEKFVQAVTQSAMAEVLQQRKV